MISKRLLPKQLLVLLLVLFCGQILRAQDLLVKKSGEVLTVFNIDIADRWVYYTQEASTDSDLKRIPREEVFSVKVAGGEMQTIGAVQPAVPAAETPKNEGPAIPVAIARPAAANNAELIARYNRVQVTGVTESEKNTKLRKPSDKPTDNGVAILKIAEGSVLSNEDIEVQIELKTQRVSLSGYKIYIKNKTNKVLYVDLANTFRIVNNGTSKVYFDDSQVTKTTGGSTGGAVNLGAVASGVGIGGAVGTIASGINVGGQKEATVSQTYKNERILKIPPMGRVALPPTYRGDGKEVKEDYDLFVVTLPTAQYGNICLWNVYNFTEAESPWKNHLSICYATKEDFSTYSNLEFSLYMSQAIGTKNTAPINWLEGFEEGVSLYSRIYILDFNEVKDAKHVESITLVGHSFAYF